VIAPAARRHRGLRWSREEATCDLYFGCSDCPGASCCRPAWWRRQRRGQRRARRADPTDAPRRRRRIAGPRRAVCRLVPGRPGDAYRLATAPELVHAEQHVAVAARLCRRILDAPLQHLEAIGVHRLLVALTADVATVTRTLQGVPAVRGQSRHLTCGTAYLGWLSLGLMLAAVAFALLAWPATGIHRVGRTPTCSGPARRTTGCSNRSAS